MACAGFRTPRPSINALEQTFVNGKTDGSNRKDKQMSQKDIGQMNEKEILGKVEYCDGRLMKVLRPNRYGWARFYETLEDSGWERRDPEFIQKGHAKFPY